MKQIYPEILLVRFTKAQKVWIRQTAKRNKASEAQAVRVAVDLMRLGK